MSEESFRVRFWGVRGSLATCGPEVARYGGETISMEVTCGNRTLVFDVGTGGRRLGNDLSERGIRNVDVFISHFHYDHIEGLPFFAPLYSADGEVNIYSAHGRDALSTRDLIEGFVRPPYFPIHPDKFVADWRCKDIVVGNALDLGDGIALATFALNHPGGATGYRITYGGKSLAIITDNEHVIGTRDEPLGRFIAGTDLVIYDAMYTDEELPRYVGYGHSTWEEGVRLCEAFGAGPLAAIHHRPLRTDAELDDLGVIAGKTRAGTLFAKQGQEVVLIP